MNGATLFAFASLLALGGCRCSGQVIDYSVEPQADDNFLEASFRFVTPSDESKPNAVLIFVPGTDGDGRGVVNNAMFLSIAKACHVALIGCNFRGEGLGYNDPSVGSGRALDEAITHFATLTHNPALPRSPLLLIGYSEGGTFAFNYVCWRPERVKAFASLKAIFPKFQPKTASFNVPGLLVAGETDAPGRVRAIANAFLGASGQHSRWAFLYESGVGHELDTQSIGLVKNLFEAVCGSSPKDESILIDAETKAPERADSTTPGACWFANQEMANNWALLHKPSPIQTLASLPDHALLEGSLAIKCDPNEYVCENENRCEGTIELTGKAPGLFINYLHISGNGFSISGPTSGSLPMQLAVQFSPHGLPWGRIRADLELGGSLNGQSLEPFTLSISGAVKGPVMAIPATAYLGVVTSGSTIDRKIHLHCNQGVLHIVDIKVPQDITATIEANAEGDPDLLIHWMPQTRLGKFSGDILLTFSAPESGTLRIPTIGVISR